MDPDSQTFEADAAVRFAQFQRQVPGFWTNDDHPWLRYGGARGGKASVISEFDLDEVRVVLREIRWSADQFDRKEWVSALAKQPHWPAAQQLTPATVASQRHNFQLALLLHNIVPKRYVAGRRRVQNCWIPLPPPQSYDGTQPSLVKRASPSHYCAKCKKITRQRNTSAHTACWARVFP